MTGPELPKSEDILSRIGENYIILNKDMEFLYASESALKLYNKKLSDIQGKTFQEVFPIFDNTEAEVAFKESLENQTETAFAYFSKIVNIWFEIRVKPFTDGLLISFSDITFQKSDYLKLLDSEERFRAIFNQAAEAILIFNMNGEIIQANPYANKVFGYGTDELTGKFIEDLIPEKLHEEHEKGRNLFLEKPNENMLHSSDNLFGRKKDDTEFPMEVSVNTFQYHNQSYMMAFVFDITERKQTEHALLSAHREIQALSKRELDQSKERFYTIFDMNPVATVIIDIATTKLLNVNTAFEKLLGIPRSIAVGKTPIELNLIKPEELQFELENLSKNNGAIQGNEIRVFIPGRGEKHILASAEYIQYNDSPSIIVTAVDITERKKSEEAISVALKKEVELNKLKTNFVSTASHEFRTPLGAILSSLSLLERYTHDNPDEKVIKHLDRIKTSVHNLTDILNDFLSVEKLEQNKLKPEASSFYFDHFLRDTIEDTDGILLQKSQKIEHHYTGPAIVEQDKKLLRNIMFNLISNASKYSPESSTIRIDAKADDHQLQIAVTDHGIGIPKEEQGNIFTRFYRATNAGAIQGTGLGLSIVKKYAELLGGKIDFYSEPDKETTFTVVLPISGREDKMEEQQHSAR